MLFLLLAFVNNILSLLGSCKMWVFPQVLSAADKLKVLEILEKINVPVDPTLVEDCHRLPSKGSPKKIIIKLNRRKDFRRILSNKNLKIQNLNWCTCPGKQKFSSVKVCVCTTKNCGPNVKGCGVLVTFPRFGSVIDR